MAAPSLAATAAPVAVPRFPPASAGVLFGLVAVAMWASYLAFARAGIAAGLEATDILVLRHAASGAIMLPWLLAHAPARLGGVGWPRGAVLALVAGPVFILLGAGGYAYAPLAHGAVIQPAAITLGAVAIAALLLGERVGAMRLAGVGVIVVGLVLIAADADGSSGPDAWRGDLMFAAAGLLWAVFTVLLKRWRVAPLAATAAVSVLSAAAVVPAVLAFGTLDRLAALGVETLIVQVIVQGVFSGVLAVLAFAMALERLGATRAALFPAMVPAATLVIGVPVAGEMPSALQIAGATLATVGLGIAMRMPARAAV